MSHDIEISIEDKAIAYINFSTMGVQAHPCAIIYHLLNATELDAGVSGNGNSMEIDEQVIRRALRYAKRGQLDIRIINFLQTSLDEMQRRNQTKATLWCG